MRRGEFKLKEQVGGKGYFGEVDLEVEDSDNGKVTVDFDQLHAQRWRTGAQFGVDYVLEHVPGRKLFPTGARVLVRSIRGHEVDTTNTVIAYVTINAFLNALGEDVVLRRSPNLDTATGFITFPK